MRGTTEPRQFKSARPDHYIKEAAIAASLKREPSTISRERLRPKSWTNYFAVKV
jgi:IS30 family transposase